MKPLLFAFLVLALLLLVAAFTWFRFNGGVSHRDICTAVRGEAAGLHEHVEQRYHDLDRKLDRIEGKLDRLLKIAESPLPDGMQEAR